MAGGNCGHHGNGIKKLCCCLFCFKLTLIIIFLSIILLVWLISRPAKPQFILENASLEKFDMSSSTNSLTSNFQITLCSRNPSSRIGIYYDNLIVFATYQGQEITQPTPLPPTYQGHKEGFCWPPFLIGGNLQVEQYVENSLTRDQNAGTVLIDINVSGDMRWKVGTSVLRKSINLKVNCPLYIIGNEGSQVGEVDKYRLQVESCNV